MNSRQREHLRETRRHQNIRETNRLMRVAFDQGLGLERAEELITNLRERGKESEHLVGKVLGSMDEVTSYRKSNEQQDRDFAVDYFAIIGSDEWKIQVKSSGKGVEKEIRKKQRQWSLANYEKTVQAMARRRCMVINARMDESQGEEESRIVEQVKWWVCLRNGLN